MHRLCARLLYRSSAINLDTKHEYKMCLGQMHGLDPRCTRTLKTNFIGEHKQVEVLPHKYNKQQ